MGLRIFLWVAVMGIALRGQTFDLAGIPSEIAAHESLVVARCATCHTMSRVLKAKHVGEEWAGVVEDMRLREKSGISLPEAEKITAFLSAWSGRGEVTPPPVTAPVPPSIPQLAGVPPRQNRRVHFRQWSLKEGTVITDVPAVVGPLEVRSLTFEAVGEQWTPVAQIAVKGRSQPIEIRVGAGLGPLGNSLHDWRIGDHRFRLDPHLEVVGEGPLQSPDPSRVRLVLAVFHTYSPAVPLSLPISSP